MKQASMAIQINGWVCVEAVVLKGRTPGCLDQSLEVTRLESRLMAILCDMTHL